MRFLIIDIYFEIYSIHLLSDSSNFESKDQDREYEN